MILKLEPHRWVEAPGNFWDLGLREGKCWILGFRCCGGSVWGRGSAYIHTWVTEVETGKQGVLSKSVAASNKFSNYWLIKKNLIDELESFFPFCCLLIWLHHAYSSLQQGDMHRQYKYEGCVCGFEFFGLFFKRWGNRPFRFIILLHVKLLKKCTNKIMGGLDSNWI